MERRRHIRVDSLNLVSFECLDAQGQGVRRGMGKTLNITEAGALLESHVALEPGETLAFSLGLEEDTVDLTARVVYTLPGDGRTVHAGVSFEAPAAGTLARLRAHLAQIRGQRPEDAETS